MDPDVSEIEMSRIGIEKNVAAAVDSLDRAIGRFRGGLRFRRETRESLSASHRKVAELRRETVQTLKAIVRKTDLLKKKIGTGAAELKELEHGEAVIKGRYKELLEGRLPLTSGEIGDAGDDFPARKRKLLENIKSTFDRLDASLGEIREKKKVIAARIERGRREVEKLSRRRSILFRKLEIYKSELFGKERELARAAELERELLTEYTKFAQAIKAAAGLPRTAENVLGGLEKDMDMAQSPGAGAWPYP